MRTTVRFRAVGVFALALAAASPLPAQEAPDTAAAPAAVPGETARSAPPKWDVTTVQGPAREVQFETDEGTWMSVDVSPDGQQIVFDLLGDIYIMPITGGQARLLLGGPAYETQPRFSPDGRRIAFTSDRDGTDNLWTMAVDGTDLKQVSKERERQVNSPVWTPDGLSLVGRKHFRNTRSLGAGEMWRFHVGGGDGLQLTTRRNWEQNAGEPEISPDGRYLFYSEDVSPGGGFQYNRDVHGVVYAVHRVDLENGDREMFLRAPGGAVRPHVSPDGNTLAFVRRVGTHTVLMLHDMRTGAERPLWNGLSQDQQEAWAIFGTYPTMAWTPDGRHLVTWAQGGIWKVDARTGEAERIPFRAHVQKSITDAVRFTQDVAPDRFDVRMLRWVSVAPDGRSVVYQALGRLWIRDLPDGTPRRLTRDESGWELYPSWSADGRTIVYTTWSDSDHGAIRTVRRDGRGARRVTTEPGHYIEPAFSRDGGRIVYRRVSGDALRGDLHSREPGVYWIPAAGGAPNLITRSGTQPRFSRSGDRVFLMTRESPGGPANTPRTGLASMNLQGGEQITHLISDNASEIALSPDERYVAWTERFQVYVAPFLPTGRTVTLSPRSTSYPVQQLSRDAGVNLHWAQDASRVYWSLGPELFHRELDRTFAYRAPDPDSVLAKPDSTGRHIGFQTETDRPRGQVALVGGTVISMRGDEVITDATVVVDGNRIVAVGPSASVQVPAGAHRVDVGGRYIMPGIVDVHAHIGNGSNGIHPQTHWGYLANLAFGVTTLHDPSSGTEMVFSASEKLRSGRMVGPRLFSTGTILYGAEGSFRANINSYEDALSHLRRLKAVGAFSVKSYNQPRRDSRQQVIAAARALEMMVVPEGGSTFFWNMTHVLDGHTGMEHNIPIAPLYNDALSLIAASETGYTPTLVVNYGGLNSELYWYQESNVWENRRLMQFVPRQMVHSRSRRRPMAAEDDYQWMEVSRSAKAMLDRGTRVLLGAHGQMQGLGAHWELWSLARGGMTNHEALRAATLHGAEYLGLDRDLGSIETGKLADIVVLDRNPLENIRDSETVRYVMVNGRLFDGWTMAQLGNSPAPAPQPRWQDLPVDWLETMSEGALHGHVGGHAHDH
jgi:imidazolonepropionase-like amidohydrolase/Tol biopolymer transport system component